MAADHRDADAGAAHLQIRQVQDLAAFVLHLHLLGGIALEGLAADLGDDVIGDLILEHLGLIALALAEGIHLSHQLDGAAGARAADRLIAGGHDALDGTELVQGVDGHQGHDGGAVGVGDDALVPLHILRVDLGDHQGHVLIQAEGAGVVHEHGAGLDDGERVLLGDIVLRRAQHQIQALKGAVGGGHDLHLAAVEGQLGARAAGAGDGTQLRHGELALLQNLHHLAAHRAGGAQNTYLELFHFATSSFTKLSYRTRMACSKSFSSTPTMMFSSSGPWVIIRMLTPCSPSLLKILPDTPRR